MIPVEFYKTELKNYDRTYLYRNYVRQRTEDDEKFLYLITDTTPVTSTGRYKNPDKSLFEWLDDVVLPEGIIDAVYDGRCCVVIDDTIEGFETKYVNPSILNFIKLNDLPTEAVYYLTSNIASQPTSYNTISELKLPIIFGILIGIKMQKIFLTKDHVPIGLMTLFACNNVLVNLE